MKNLEDVTNKALIAIEAIGEYVDQLERNNKELTNENIRLSNKVERLEKKLEKYEGGQ
jgi:predicted RNase H-like nuclease (RuvC/YqgF family)